MKNKLLLLTFLLGYKLFGLEYITNETTSYNLIYATGKIKRGDLYRLKKIYYSLPKKRKQTIVVFNSEGGEVSEGIKLGKFFKNRGIGTAVQKGGYCVSSCAISFLGGRDKYGRKLMILPRGSKLGFHAFYYRNREYVKPSKVQKDLSTLINYFKYVNAPINLLYNMFKTNSKKVYWVKVRDRILPLKRGYQLTKEMRASRTVSNLKSSKKSAKLEYMKEYFSRVNKIIKSYSGYYNKYEALNSNKSDYKSWLGAVLKYVHIKSLKLVRKNFVRAKVIYALKDGSYICSNNYYKMKMSKNRWKVISKQTYPCNRKSKNLIKRLSRNLP